VVNDDVDRVVDMVARELMADALSGRQREQFETFTTAIRAAFHADQDRNLACVNIPLIIARGLGARPESADVGAVVSTIVYAAARLVDDVMDGHGLSYAVRSPHEVLGVTTALAGAIYRYIIRTPLSARQRLALVAEVSEMVVVMAAGQLADVAAFGTVLPADDVLKTVEQKSGAMLAGFASCGAVTADAADAQVAACRQFGRSLGVARQISSDLYELAQPGNADARNAAPTFPVAVHLASLTFDDQWRFVERLREASKSPSLLATIREEMEASGALAAAALQAEVSLCAASVALGRIDLSPPSHCRLNDLIRQSEYEGSRK
jgi:geranylgeranyl pyrophosphate synthase